MIKIIKEGKLPKIYKTIFSAECPHCHCQFEFEREDFTKIEKQFFGNYFIKCPCCGTELSGKYEYFNPRDVEVKEDNLW